MPRNPFAHYRLPLLSAGLTSLPNFLGALGISLKELRLISARKHNQYHIVSIAKRSGGLRTLSVPNDRLMYIQRAINDLLLPLYKPRWCVQGFVKERSALSNAQKHLGRNHLVKIDFADYFDQVSSRRIKGVLLYFGIPPGVCDAIVILCTLNNRLPQGAPTSPLLANMVTFRFDQVMLEFSKINRLRYTRYADDITLSSFSRPRILKSSVDTSYVKLKFDDIDQSFLRIFSNEGFQINEEKLYYCGRTSRRAVTGYTVNEFVNVPRKHIRQIRAILHDIEGRGYPAAQYRYSQKTNSIKSLKSSLRGRIGWVSSTKGFSDPVYRNLAARYNSLFSPDSLKIGPDFSKLATMSTWVLEAEDSATKIPEAQGTAFFLRGAGLITAAHCLPASCDFKVFNVDNPAIKYDVSIAKVHPHVDLAILDHKIPTDKFIELEVASREPNVGEDVISWGFPDFGPGKQMTRKTGKISSKPTLSTVEMYAVDFKIYQGSSGGPILNSASNVIAVAHKGGDGEAHDLAVKIHQLSHL